MTLRTFVLFAAAIFTAKASACTGITLKTAEGQTVVARTIEWGGSDLKSSRVIVPRGYRQRAYSPNGVKDGMEFTARYGYVGLAVEQDEFVAEGLNEEGLSAGLFYFPKYGKYEEYSEADKQASIGDLQLVPWLLGSFKTVEEAVQGIKNVHIVTIDPRASTTHWRIADKSGRQVVLEITDGTPHIYENTLGVLTNSPGFEWHLINLNNYINLQPGTITDGKLGDMRLSSFGAGTGFLGLPGDVTPPSRFVRAAFFQASAPQGQTAEATVRQCFQILNNFDIPIGIEFREGETPADLPSATQWTSATDIAGLKIYYRTMRNSAIRMIDLKKIGFDRVQYQSAPLDTVREQPIEEIIIK